MEKLTLTPNVPVQIALKFPDGKLVEGRFGDQMMYSLTNGQVAYLDMDVAQKINLLELRRNETFCLCKRWTGKKGDPQLIDVWRPDAASIATGLPPTAVDGEIASRQQTDAGARPNANSFVAPAPATAITQPPSSNNGNGSTSNGNGNGANGAPKPYAAAGAPPPPPVKVGYDVALRRILRVATTELKTAGEQWSDAARQDLVSTLMIQAARDGVITWLPLTREEGN